MKTDLLEAMRRQANPSVAPKSKKVPTEGSSTGQQRSRVGKRQVAAYFPAAVQKQLKLLTIDNDTTVQDLLAEALNDLFAKYGKPEIAPTSDSA